MEVYKYATHLHFDEKRWRCPVCAYEEPEITQREIVKPKKKKE